MDGASIQPTALPTKHENGQIQSEIYHAIGEELSIAFCHFAYPKHSVLRKQIASLRTKKFVCKIFGSLELFEILNIYFIFRHNGLVHWFEHFTK